MGGIKLLFRRTLVSTSAVNLPPPPAKPKHRRTSITLSGATATCRSTLASGACLRLSGAHVTPTTTKNTIKPIMMGSNSNNRKRLYILSPAASSSSSSSSSPSSSPSSSIEERESPSSRVSASVVEDMGHESNKATRGSISSGKNNQNQKTKLLTLPTILTLARVAAIPVFIGTFYVNNWWGTTATTSIFLGAAITDWLDGYLARKMGLGTTFGAFLDPVADKLMVAATLVLLCSRPPETAILGDAPWLFPVPAIAIIGREVCTVINVILLTQITMSAVREWAASQNTQLLQAVAVNSLGKWKTATQMIALTLLLATRDSSLGGSGPLMTTGVALLYASAGLAVWSLVVYIRKIWKVLLR